jgi:hypothetical protein
VSTTTVKTVATMIGADCRRRLSSSEPRWFPIVNELIKQNDQADNMRSAFVVRARLPKQQPYKATMPTFIKMVAKLEEPAGFFGDDFRAVALFGGIGLLLTLIAVSKGVQGVWF